MEFLKETRLQKEFTLSEVSKKAGISENYLSQLENGKRKPSVKMAKKIADFYKIDWTKFFE